MARPDWWDGTVPETPDDRPSRSDLAGEGFTYPIRLTGTAWTVGPDPWQQPGALSDFVSGKTRTTNL
jgi:hypothetical protein